ncbi:MAG TPA: DUF805 domain-containing protein [Rhodanobacteraceae bacterium]|jgi:uncharacterized membrane protein YhaH (DUF805 family)
MHWYFAVVGKYATFAGRARRKEYWMFALVNFVICVALAIAGMVMLGKSQNSALVMDAVLGVYLLLILLPSLAVTVRRLHDTGRSGWWFWIQLVPFVGPIVLFVFTVLDGTPGTNAYGPSPKGA